MIKTIMFGLVLATVALSGIMSAASAETAPSPLQQVCDGVPTDEVMCSENRVLMMSLSGPPACVFAGSVEVLERRGFVLPSEMPRDDLSSKRPETLEKSVETGSPDASKTGDRPFVTTWQTVSSNESITIPVGNAIGTYTVDWGDGRTTANVTGNQTHVYGEAGTYTVTITGNFERIRLNGDPDNAAKLQSIEQWGAIKWLSMDSAFEGAYNMIYNADDIPDLSGITNMSRMFAGAIHFDGDLSDWNVSGVTDMSWMFRNTPFNSDLSDWNVSGVTDMSGMFNGASSFNSDISAWNVSGVTDMSEMFARALSFHSDISAWKRLRRD